MKILNHLRFIIAVFPFTISNGLAQSVVEKADVTIPGESSPDSAEIQPLLVKNTCIACHEMEKRKIGPPFRAIAEREYSREEIVGLIYEPKPEHWPDYPVPMPPMLQVSKEDARKIAVWINSLDDDQAD